MRAPSPLDVSLGETRAVPIDRRRESPEGPAGLGRTVGSLLSQVVLFVAAACGAVGLPWLLCDFCEIGFAWWSLLPAVLTLGLVWASASFLGRGWPGLLVAVAAVVFVAYLWREDLSGQASLAWDAVSSWSLLEGDIDRLLRVAFGALGTLVGVCVFCWNRGWIVSLGALALLLACPLEGVEPDVAAVALLVLYTVGTLASGYVGRRFERRPSVVALGLAIACVGLAVALLAAHLAPEAFRAPGRALSGAIDDAWSAAASRIGTDANTPVGSRGPSAGLEEGMVNRGSLPEADGRPLVSVELSGAPLYPLYLASFHGESYGDGVWREVEEPSMAGGVAQGSALESFGQQSLLYSAEFFAASVYALGVGDGLLPGLEIQLGSPGSAVDVDTLRPYAAIAVRSNVAGRSAFDAVGIGAFETLCELGILNYDTPIGSLLGGPSATGYLYDRGLELAYPGGQTLLAAESVFDSYGSWARSVCLEVPYEELPRLSRLVAQNPCATQGEAIAFVKETLAQNARYTTTPGEFPSDASIAEYLLFDGHEGYCQHFATAAVLMLRMYGIPSRYVTGFAAPPSAFFQTVGGAWESTFGNARAHAWVEVYTANLGWVPVEVTPAEARDAAPFAAVDPANALDAEGPGDEAGQLLEQEEETGEEPSTTQPEGSPDNQGLPETTDKLQEPVPHSPTDPEAQPDDGEVPIAPEDAATSFAAGPIAVGTSILSAATLAGLLLWMHRRRVAEARATLGPDAILADLVSMVHFAGLMEERYGTEEGFALELAHECDGVEAAHVQRLVDRAMDAAFGDPGGARPLPGSEDLATYREVAQAVYRGLDPLRKLLFVWIKAYV